MNKEAIKQKCYPIFRALLLIFLGFSYFRKHQEIARVLLGVFYLFKKKKFRKFIASVLSAKPLNLLLFLLFLKCRKKISRTHSQKFFLFFPYQGKITVLQIFRETPFFLSIDIKKIFK
jgi:hypothetical protein